MTTTTTEPTVAEIEEQEARLVFASFGHADAWRLGSLLVELGTERGLGIAIDITLGEQQVFHAALAGSSADNDNWIARKSRVVRRFNEASLRTRLRFAPEPGPDWLDDSYAVFGGSFPIRTPGGVTLGTVTVSGLPDVDDHALVVEALETVLSAG